MQYPFNSLEAIIYDFAVRYDFLHDKNDKVVVIEVDEESEEFLGDLYPFSYSTLTKFFERLTAASPKVIASLLEFRNVGDQGNKKQEKLIRVLKKYRSKNNIVMGVSQHEKGGARSLGWQASFDHGFSNIFPDDTNFSKDKIVRRASYTTGGRDSFHKLVVDKYNWMEGLRSKQPPLSYSIKDDSNFFNMRYGSYFNNFRDNVITIPFHRILVGSLPQEILTDKIVLISPKFFSRDEDYYSTPFSKFSDKTPVSFVHYAIINSLLSAKTVKVLPNDISKAIAALIAFIVAFLISRMQPTKGLLIVLLSIIAVFGFSYVLFSFLGLWLKISHIILGVFVVYYIWVPFRAIGEYQSRYAFEEEARLLKKVDDLKKNFISLMSHDLKTPVAKISGVAQRLRRFEGYNEKQRELLEVIESSTNELNRFISSILDVTKVESKDFSLNLSSKDVNSIVENVVKRLSYEASNANVKIRCEFGALYPIKVDVDLINKVISNIVENAIKYSGKGSEITIRTWDDDIWVYLQVKDNGIGITEEALKNIFDKFYRVKNDQTHEIKGTGLGLYLVKYFIELHNGKVSVSSKVGSGTSFLIQLRNE